MFGCTFSTTSLFKYVNQPILYLGEFSKGNAESRKSIKQKSEKNTKIKQDTTIA